MKNRTSYGVGTIFHAKGTDIWSVTRLDGSLRNFDNYKQAKRFSDKVKAHRKANPPPPPFQFIYDTLAEKAIEEYGWLPKDNHIATLKKRYGRLPTDEEIKAYGLEIGALPVPTPGGTQ